MENMNNEAVRLFTVFLQKKKEISNFKKIKQMVRSLSTSELHEIVMSHPEVSNCSLTIKKNLEQFHEELFTN